MMNVLLTIPQALTLIQAAYARSFNAIFHMRLETGFGHHLSVENPGNQG